MRTIIATLLGFAVAALAQTAAPPNRLPKSLPPEIYAWFWFENVEFAPEGYRRFIDMISEESNFGLLTTSLRAPAHELTLPETHDQIKRAVEYAHQRGLRVAFDLDVRLARGTFQKKYPGQQQWMLRVRSFSSKQQPLVVEPVPLSDHMTWIGGSYELLDGQLMGLWRVNGSSLERVRTGYRIAEQSARRVAVETGADTATGGDWVVAAAFEYRTPDVFAPALLDFQKAIYEQYRDVPLDGAMKDEWGFPPVVNQGPKDGDFWYSKALAAGYAKAGGGDFIRDCVLMTLGAGGTYQQRTLAVNRYMRLILTRNAAIERNYYENVKRVFGPDAFAGTHATWGYMPQGDAFKNGYDWWWAQRDYGQTDEHWPLSVRTALAKKMGKPVWYNQFYDRDVEPYFREIWRDARAGGRVNFHPLWPSPVNGETHALLLHSPLMKAENRIRLLNYITRAPLDCPVAVVFGHPAALNWIGAHFGDLGVDFAEDLARRGVRADVIPSTEIESGALRLDAGDGQVTYGAQRYRALVFLNPDYEPPATFEFLRRVARSRTALFVRDETRLAPDGSPRSDAESLIPGAGLNPTPSRVAQFLVNWHSPQQLPPDLSRLTDGTCLLARGEKDPAGDRIDETFYCGGVKVRARATGVFAIRLSPSGELESLAASGLQQVQAGKFRLDLPDSTDVALWRDPAGKYQGVVQGTWPVPQPLLAITDNWTGLALSLSK